MRTLAAFPNQNRTALWLAVSILLLLALRGGTMWDALQVNRAALAGLNPEAELPATTTLTETGACRLAHVTGRSMANRGNYPAALPYLEAGAACDNNRFAWYDLGRVQNELGDLAGTEESWRQGNWYVPANRLAGTVVQDPESTLPEKLAALEFVARIAPDKGQPYVGMAALILPDDPAGAEAFLNQALAVEPDLDTAYAALGSLYSEKYQDYAQAYTYFQQAVALKPFSFPYNFAIAQLAEKAGDDAGALYYWEQVGPLRAQTYLARSQYERGRILLKLGEPELALDILLPLLGESPENVQAVLLAGQAYAALGCNAEARLTYIYAQSLSMNDALARQRDDALAALPAGPGSGSCAAPTFIQ